MPKLKSVKVPAKVEGAESLESAAKAARELQASRPGWQTTEFALTALMVVAVTVLIAVGRMEVDDIFELWPLAAGIGGYALSRGMAKGRVG